MIATVMVRIATDCQKLCFSFRSVLSKESPQTPKCHIEANQPDFENDENSLISASQPNWPESNSTTISVQPISSHTNAINDRSQVDTDETAFGRPTSSSKESEGIRLSAGDEDDQTELTKIKDARMRIWKRLLDTLKWTTKLCYILCPPVPSLMLRKAVFHPPKRCHHYFLIGEKDDRRQHFRDAKDAQGSTNLIICLPHLLLPNYKNSDVADQLLRIEVRLITSANGDTIVSLYVRCEKSYRCKKSSPYVILFAQPNSSDVGSCMLTDPNLVDIADFLQCDLMAFDYSGFGLSTGTPTEKNVYQNMETVFQYLIKEMRARPNEIIIIGFSMGAAVAIHLASREKVAGLVLIAPFTSLLRIIGRKPWSERTCCMDQFSSINKVSKITCRTLICHGVKDVIVSINHSVALQRRLPNAAIPCYLEKATHQSIYCERKTWDRIQHFLFHELGNIRKWSEPMKTNRTFVNYAL